MTKQLIYVKAFKVGTECWIVPVYDVSEMQPRTAPIEVVITDIQNFLLSPLTVSPAVTAEKLTSLIDLLADPWFVRIPK